MDGQPQTEYRLVVGAQRLGRLLDQRPAGTTYDEHERPGESRRLAGDGAKAPSQ
ncbi:hypothetical protein AB0885_38030 [Streptomyces sp. NPDC005534]|uniref:hypothetical protein n=1 Tax=Streptomyces sp. NPDC005534 TaxID=3155714 RepID=UPI003456F9DD